MPLPQSSASTSPQKQETQGDLYTLIPAIFITAATATTKKIKGIDKTIATTIQITNIAA